MPASTVYNWVTGRHSPFGSCRNANLSPSSSLSYLAGYFVGDGNIFRGSSYHYELRFRVRDREFAEEFGIASGVVLRKPLAVRIDSKGFYTVRLSSRLIFNYLSSLDSIIQSADQFPRDFIRGFADAEVSPAISVTRSETPMLGFYIVLVDTDLEILTYIRRLLRRKLGIRSLVMIGKRHRSSMWSKPPCYYLKVGRREDQRRYASLVGFGMRRKQLKMMVGSFPIR